jgi:transcriptional regulator with XRE-family HTH domain
VPQSTIARIESGARRPSLARILAAVNLELRINLEAYDAHDDVLDAEDARLTAAQRLARRQAQKYSSAHRPGVRPDGLGGLFAALLHRRTQPPRTAWAFDRYLLPWIYWKLLVNGRL